MSRQIVLSDIHGCRLTMLALLDQLAFSKSDELFMLGDYVDRGPDSKGVVDTIWKMQEDGYSVRCIMGNHEELTYCDYDNELRSGWTGIGDVPFMKSFGIKKLADIPIQYIDWMRNLPRFIEIPGYVLVHAGIEFNGPNPLVHKEALVWIRNWYKTVDRDWLNGRLIVHGHVPIPVVKVKAMFEQHDKLPVQNIDSGAVFRSQHLGELCAFDLTNRQLVFQRNVEIPKVKKGS